MEKDAMYFITFSYPLKMKLLAVYILMSFLDIKLCSKAQEVAWKKLFMLLMNKCSYIKK